VNKLCILGAVVFSKPNLQNKNRRQKSVQCWTTEYEI